MRTFGVLVLSTFAGAIALAPAQGLAKGLDAIADKNPETAAPAADGDGDEDGKTQDAGKDAAAAAAPLEKSETSKKIAGKLNLDTSVGWVRVKRSKGSWSASGMADFGVGYKLAAVSGFDVAGTYRYAPIAVSGKQDNQSYRGVWDTHYVGARGQTTVKGLTVFGTGELGLALVYLNSVDGLPLKSDTEANGVLVAVGGGADWKVIDKAWSVGPRVHLAVGSMTTLQVSAATSYIF